MAQNTHGYTVAQKPSSEIHKEKKKRAGQPGLKPVAENGPLSARRPARSRALLPAIRWESTVRVDRGWNKTAARPEP